MTGNTAWHKWSTKLAISLDRDFERACLPFLRLLWPEMIIPKPLSKWDRQGIDLIAFGDQAEAPCIVQCKTSQSKLLGKDDIRQAVDSINKFERSDQNCGTYLFLINGDGRSVEYNAAIESRLRALASSGGKAGRAELWNRQELLMRTFNRMKEILIHALVKRSRERRDLFRDMFRFGSVYLPDVPVTEERLVLKPGAPCERIGVRPLSTRILAGLLQDYSQARWTLLTGLFGAGKTTAALEAASTGEHTAIFVSAADLGEDMMRHGTNGLAQEIVGSLGIFERGAGPIDGFYVLDEGDEETFNRLAGPALVSILRSEEPEHVLVLDGLDENRVYLSPNGLQLLNNQLADLNCPIVLTTRFEHMSTMFGNFEALLEGLGKKRRSSRPALLLTLAPWTTAEVRRFAEGASRSATPDEREALTSFMRALDDGSLSRLYGDLPNHPLFLQFILDDICSSGLRERSRTELIGSWVRRKIWRDVDHHGIPLDQPTDRNEWLGKMLLLTEAVAATMTTGTEDVQLVEFSEAAEIEGISARIFDRKLPISILLLYTVLVPKTMRVGDKLEIRFVLRLLQEYFLAKHLKRTRIPPDRYPDSVRSLVDDLDGDID